MKTRLLSLLALLFFAIGTGDGLVQAQDSPDRRYEVAPGALSFRSIGPALTAGRIADFAVNPDDHSEFYVAVASGNVWKTTNGGTTFEPIFDNYGSYSIGCITMDPNNHNVIWVGTGENNNQRSVAYGDGVYKSVDGGKSFSHMGLENSEHIGMIAVDPRDSDVVYVAAYGPLWSAGGDRGLYKSTDGGENWEAVLTVSEHTGFNEVHLDPRNPDIVYATAHQRRRHVFTQISGGPESALYKSTDAGQSWEKAMNGIGGTWVGRIGMDISPVDPDVLYAVVEGDEGSEGFYRSTDRGASWEKRSNYSSSGNYYNEIVADPHDVDRVYTMDTYSQKTEDGGLTWENTGENSKHIDNHALWIDPDNPDHLLNGNDGGVYESYDQAETWRFFPNLPITQFYKVTVDSAKPFYNVLGGTQDNYSQRGPSRTTSAHGITNADWNITLGGDGFESAADPENPNIIYAQSQYGNLVRFNMETKERVSIQPQPREGQKELTYNWDAPLVISPHNNETLYFAADKVFRSTNRGDSWEAISGDLTQQIDRNRLEVMGRVWPMDAVAKNSSTSEYGNIVALDESHVQSGVIYAGTDDGLVHVTRDGGENWNEYGSFPTVPDRTYVNDLVTSHHDAGTVYAAFNNHKNGDFAPYLLKSTDYGESWTDITSNLPERGSVYAVAEDHENPDILFAGTEFGFFYTLDGGEHWEQITSGLPTIAVRDIAIHYQEDDIVLGTFGRSFYILDDYSPLRELTQENLDREAHIFDIADAKMFIEYSRVGSLGGQKGFQGETFFTADNPPVAATIRYYLKESIKTLEQQREEEEMEKFREGEPAYYPSYEEYKAEQEELQPYLLFTITDTEGNVIRELRQPANQGMHEVHWDFHYPDMTQANPDNAGAMSEPDEGIMAMPGTYQVTVSKSVAGEITQIAGPESFEVDYLYESDLTPGEQSARVEFQQKVSELSKALNGVQRAISSAQEKLDYYKAALKAMNRSTSELFSQIRTAEDSLRSIRTSLFGDPYRGDLDMDEQATLTSRLGSITYGFNSYTGAPTGSMQRQYEIAADQFGPIYDRLERFLNNQMPAIQRQMDQMNAPWTPDRLPDWDGN